MKAAGDWHHAVLQDVLYVPELHGNLLSVSQLARCGADVRFAKGGCQIYDQHGALTCEGPLRGNLYIMPVRVVASEESARVSILPMDALPINGDVATPNAKIALAARNSTSKADVHTWHRRLSHLHIDAVLAMAKKGMVKGMEIVGSHSPPDTCKPCLKGKQTCAKIHKSTKSRAADILGRVFSDICGKLPTRSHHGFEYFVTWIDDASHKVFVTGLCEKYKVGEHLKAFVARVELEMGKRLKVLRTDGGGEYIASAVQEFLKSKGVQHEITTPDTPQHNGVAERMNCTLLDKV
jgi:hypothetical protein